MVKYKIEFDRDNCRGCGACTNCDNWKFDNDGKVSPIKTELNKIGCNQESADICPMKIIRIKKQ